MKNVLNSSRRNIELFGDVAHVTTRGFAKLPNIKNLLLGKFGGWIVASFDGAILHHLGHRFSFAMSSFCNHISHIVCASSKKEVVRVAARRIVAMVKHGQAFWNRAFNLLIGVAMSGNNLAKYHVISIPLFTGTSCPEPARAEFWSPCRNWAVFINLLPECFRRIGVWSCHNNQTPTRHAGKSASASGSVTDGRKSVFALLLSATFRPQSFCLQPA